MATATGSSGTHSEQFRTVVRNGYTYRIDARERTRRVSGALTVAAVPSRSRTSQRQAGGAERRASDDGGHYIAARFNGPTEAFNHFAQNANFNRGGYRLLEDEWARDKRDRKAVNVKIIPLLMADSEYPSEPTLLYAQLDHNMIGESIFKIIGNQFLHRRPVNQRLPYALLELWEAQDGQDRWSELEYVLRDGQFEVAYYHPDEIDSQEDVIERRRRALHRRFGEKPIVYPPLFSEDEPEGYDG